MPIYEFLCPIHGKFEIIKSISEASSKCPECGELSEKVLSRVALIRVHHTENLPYDHPLRVDDRQRMMKDTAVKKALGDYTESQRYSKGSPYNTLEV